MTTTDQLNANTTATDTDADSELAVSGVTHDPVTGARTEVLPPPPGTDSDQEPAPHVTTELPAAPDQGSPEGGAEAKPPFIQRTWVRITGGVLAIALLLGAGFGVGWAAHDASEGTSELARGAPAMHDDRQPPGAGDVPGEGQLPFPGDDLDAGQSGT